MIETKTSIKECQRYIFIKPTPQQIFQPMSGEADLDYMFTDVNSEFLEQNPGLKKKFKVRITSKSTGKKIDVNLEFKRDGAHALSIDPELAKEALEAATNFSWVGLI